MTIALFVLALFTIIIPTIEHNSLERKREMIRELTNAAWNILAKFEYDEQLGLLSRPEAQRQAIEQVRNLHYGERMKDYFWINDMHPRMVIHPYRTDLNGKDLSPENVEAASDLAASEARPVKTTVYSPSHKKRMMKLLMQNAAQAAKRRSSE